MTAYGIMFHHFYNAMFPRVQDSLSSQEIADILNFLGRDCIISAKTWMERALRESDICITFDDALRCQYEVALPILSNFEITAFSLSTRRIFKERRNPFNSTGILGPLPSTTLTNSTMFLSRNGTTN